MAEIFGHLPCGTPVHRLRLVGGGMVAHVLTLGAIVQDLRLQGHDAPLTLGADTLAPYLDEMAFFGALVGRVANRIAGGQFVLGGKVHQLSRNDPGGHCLHGGAQGTFARVWNIRAQGTDHVTLALLLEDGEMGFPGVLELEAHIALEDQAIRFEIMAKAEADTLCNIAQHSYFALDDTGDLRAHALRIAAENYLPVDDTNIPTGDIAPVAGTQFDLRTAQCPQSARLDHNFCLAPARAALRPVAWLRSQHSGVSMVLETTEPGLQVYNAHAMALAAPGLGGRHYGPHAGIALEAQGWPDAPNHPHFPPVTLRAGETCHQITRYRFALGEAPE